MKSRIFLGGGCFWCVEAKFSAQKGIQCMPGYMGGDLANPKYEEVCTGTTGHFEVCSIENFKSLDMVLDLFWKIIDPFDITGQFADRGQQYQSVIFYTNQSQKETAIKSKQNVEEKLGKVVQTLILPASDFYPAEVYHQKFYLKNPKYYECYLHASGRESRCKNIWK